MGLTQGYHTMHSIEYMYKCMHYKEVKKSTSRVIAKRTSQIMKYGQDVIIQKWTDDNRSFIFRLVLNGIVLGWKMSMLSPSKNSLHIFMCIFECYLFDI